MHHEILSYMLIALVVYQTNAALRSGTSLHSLDDGCVTQTAWFAFEDRMRLCSRVYIDEGFLLPVSTSGRASGIVFNLDTTGEKRIQRKRTGAQV